MTDIKEQIAEHKINETNDLRKRSGTVKYKSKLVSFLYELIRDHVPAGVIEGVVHNSTLNPDVTYTNGHLANYAQDIAARLSPFERTSIEKNYFWYEPARPNATYAPWLDAYGFRDCYEKIKDNTLVDIYRCYELWTLTEQVCKLPSGAFIEVGVWKGGTAALIAKMARCSNVGSSKIYLCDTFTGVAKASERDSTYHGGEHSDTTIGDVESLFDRMAPGSPYIKHDLVILQGLFPEETSYRIQADETFRLCHIDVDVYESAKGVNEWVWPKMVHGGIVVYDDYGFMACDGVTQYVNEQKDYNDRIVTHNLNGHAVVIKL